MEKLLHSAITESGSPQSTPRTAAARARTVLVLNPKGGCGKTTIATNLATCFAARAVAPTVIDYDPQGCAMRWHRLRAQDCPPVHAIAAFKSAGSATRSWLLTPPQGTDWVIIDAPAGVHQFQLQDFLRRVDAVLIPVLPSSIDIFAASDFIRDLLLIGKARAYGTQLAVVANRVNERTRSYQALERFLQTLKIPFVARLRDTQNYVRAAEQGLGIQELGHRSVQRDIEQWEPLLSWLEQLPPRHPST